MADYLVTRSTTIDAPPDRVRALVEDLHAWTRWSPWEGVDPDLRRTYSGPDRGVGAAYAWEGNRRAGAGSMVVTAVGEDAVEVHLEFLKPFRSTSEVTFRLTPHATGCTTTWEMRGTRSGVAGVLSRLVPVDALIGKDFEKGLARLKAVAEHDPA